MNIQTTLMEAPSLLLHSSSGTELVHAEGYAGVSIAELEFLHRQAGEAIVSLKGRSMQIEGELMKRQPGRKSG